MIKITKSSPPKILAKFKRTPLDISDPFDDPVVKSVIRQKLLDDQKGICAYCMSRIGMNNSVIEHISPKSIYRHLARDYANLILCCDNRNNHCDKSKGSNQLKKVNKAIFVCIDHYIEYHYSGDITSCDSDIDSDLNDEKLLNLNKALYLSRNRRAIMVEIEKEINKKRHLGLPGSQIKSYLSKKLTEEKNRTILSPFSGVYIYMYQNYINKL